MITATIARDPQGEIVGFTVENHGDSIVCAAVSMLVLNTVNSVDFLTEDKFTCDYNENGGYLTFSLSAPLFRSDGVRILLDAMFLGLTSAKKEYPDEIEIKETVT